MSLRQYTSRKSINTNENTEGIFSLVNCRWILPTEIFPRVFTEGIIVGKKIIKRKQKKWWRVIFNNGNSVKKIVGKLSTLFIMLITKGITDRTFRWYFIESSRTIYFPITLLITVLYRQNHRRIEKSSMLFGGFLKIFN
jgi:hypothetical protein